MERQIPIKEYSLSPDSNPNFLTVKDTLSPLSLSKIRSSNYFLFSIAKATTKLSNSYLILIPAYNSINNQSMNPQLFTEHQIFPQDKALSGQRRREEKIKNPEKIQYRKQPNGDVPSANINSIPCPASTER